MLRFSYLFLHPASCILNLGLAQAQEAQNVFIEVGSNSPDVLRTTHREKSQGIVSKRLVDVNIQALHDGSRVQSAKFSSLSAGRKGRDGFVIRLPGGVEATLNTRRLHSYVKGVETYSGRVNGIESGYFTLSVEDEKVYGQINIEFMAYDIRHDNTYGTHVLTEIDLAKMPKHSPDPLNSESSGVVTPKAGNMPDAMSGSSNGTVRVLVLHGSDVSSVSTLTANIISAMNDTFFGDGMDPDLHVTLADIRNLGDDLDEVCKETILELMEEPDPPFANIATWMSDEDADVVLTIATTDPTVDDCPDTGVWGRIGGQASALLDATRPFAVSMDSYAVGDLTAPHELGHVLGGGHSTTSPALLDTWSGGESEPFSRGYIGSEGEWQTVMGDYSENGCDFSTTLPNTDCVRLPLWSDPTKTYDSEARGVTYVSEEQDPWSADMVSALEIQMPDVAAWDTYSYSAPGSVSGIYIEECYQNNIISWNNTTNAEHYQALLSYSSSFTDPEVIYFASQAGVNVRVFSGQPTKYVKIRACNGGGCGSYSYMLTLTYNPSCA